MGEKKSNGHAKSVEGQKITEPEKKKQSPQAGVPAPPIPPDGGYGWVILFASFMINVLVDGVCFSFGIFFMEFLNHYRESKGKTSWVGSVLNGMYLSMGPIVSALANRYGCRPVCMVGSLVASAGFFLSTFSPNVDILILLYGGVGGLGFGLMYLPAIVMVGFYFEKRRAFATGVAVCGSGIGAFVFAPMCDKLLEVYDWRGATWIMSGIVLNGMVMGALLRPLESPKTSKSQRKGKEDAEHLLTDTEMNGKNGLIVQKGLLNEEPSCVHSMHNLYSPTKDEQSTELVVRQCSHQYSSHGDLALRDDEHTVMRKRFQQQQQKEQISKPFYRKDIFYTGSVASLPEFKEQKDPESYARSITSIPHGDTADGDTDTRYEGCCGKCRSMTDTLRTMMDFSLLKNPIFCLYGMSCFLCMTGFFVPFIYLPDNALAQDSTREQAAFLVSIIGIANTVGRVATGWISDRPWADCLLINNVALLLGGIATILCPFAVNYPLLCVYSAVFGWCIAAFVSLRSIIMVELMGLEKLTNAFGLVTMCQGLSSFIGAPIAGTLYDVTGNYNLSFYVAGTTLALAGIICFPLRKISHWYDRRQMARLALNGHVDGTTVESHLNEADRRV